MSCHSATANQVRLVLHTAAFWLMHGVRAAIPPTNPLANAEFATIRERLIKIGARLIEHIELTAIAVGVGMVIAFAAAIISSSVAVSRAYIRFSRTEAWKR